MKLLTINTHSLAEEDYDKKLLIFADMIEQLKPDVVAMQEVNQTICEKIYDIKKNDNITVLGDIPVKCDNHGLSVMKELKKRGIAYNLVWVGIKKSYETFEEGIAIMSKEKISACDEYTVSDTNDYRNWRKRKIVGAKTQNQWFYSVHLGWWNDDEEPFLKHWERILKDLKNKENVWLMGDFNSEADVEGEGYSAILKTGWYDTYDLADKKDNGYTVMGKIDGWQNSESDCKRIDYIFTDSKKNIKSSYVIFNGQNYDVISDHYGVLVQTE